jgi:hypothetical protein
MNIHSLLRLLFLSAVLCLPASTAQAAKTPDAGSADALTRTIAALDSKVFDAFNTCDLKTFGEYFTFNVEFYHDLGGVTWTRKRMIHNTRKNICGKVRRELIAGSLEVYPIKGYGAVQMGTHRFCQQGSDDCTGIARFTHIWKRVDDAWVVTRVISYDHRELPRS